MENTTMTQVTSTQRGALGGQLYGALVRRQRPDAGLRVPAWSHDVAFRALAASPIPTDNSTGVSVPGPRYRT